METLKITIDEDADIGVAILDASELLDVGDSIRVSFYDCEKTFLSVATITAKDGGEYVVSYVSYNGYSDEGTEVGFSHDGDYPTASEEASPSLPQFWADNPMPDPEDEPVIMGKERPAARELNKRAREAEAAWLGGTAKGRRRKLPKVA